MASGTILTAAQAAAAQPVQMYTTTWNTFNHMYFMYQMLTAIEFIIVALLFFLFKSYIPFVVSKLWTHLPVIGVMNRNRHTAAFGGFTLRNGMYRKEYKNTTMYFVKKYLGSFFFMGCPFDIVHIDRAFVQDPIYNKYITSLTERGYPRWRDVQDALDVNDIDPSSSITQDLADGYGCANYKELREFLNPYGLTKTTVLYAPKYSNVPQDSLLAYGKNASPGTIAAWIDHWYEFIKDEIEKSLLWEWAPYIFVIIAVCLGGYILAMAIQHGHG